MKSKKLVILLFALAIVTVLSAGTLAIYTTRIDTMATTSVTAKRFILEADAPISDQLTFRLAPGETITTENITFSNYDENGNTSEVDMDLLISIKGGTRAFFNTMPGVEIELVQNGASVYSWKADQISAIESGDADYFLSNAFAASVSSDQVYQLRVTWHDTGDERSQINSATAQNSQAFSLYAKATQHVEGASEVA